MSLNLKAADAGFLQKRAWNDYSWSGTAKELKQRNTKNQQIRRTWDVKSRLWRYESI